MGRVWSVGLIFLGDTIRGEALLFVLVEALLFMLVEAVEPKAQGLLLSEELLQGFCRPSKVLSGSTLPFFQNRVAERIRRIDSMIRLHEQVVRRRGKKKIGLG